MDTIKKLIKDKGQRFTSQKKEILCALQQKPQTVLEIYKAVNSKKNSMDKTTVYRILTNFLDLGIVNKVQLNDKEARFELSNRKHHHHLVCEDCGNIENIQLPEDTLLKVVKKKSDFKIKSHSLEFFGVCKHCQ
ncbi:transcriptional repressor [Candidatus Roizmanbacteria bacterium CG_4_10_14_0_8_um_filter_33_9]|uniref:Transcriptional repressor n=1 Tax=Candidatus Roizmanbacteria bacterium CG_4_10_14_0_8_um_filter_33_9 TaxID=1974826 RepID=A0A2M7QI68_9BACT|nr:MAG: transcriptional repressor [Candidatus Roizmanbacteria bacterium CG_4_10_14_0_8_um_filter_33_9]